MRCERETARGAIGAATGGLSVTNVRSRVPSNKKVRLVLIYSRCVNTERREPKWVNVQKNAASEPGSQAPCYRLVKSGRQDEIKGATAKLGSSLIPR